MTDANSRPATPPQPTRSCGGCTMCCKALAIKQLEKAVGVACKHLVAGGCGVQSERQGNPDYFDCNTYNCLWLLGDLEEKDRPDKIKAVFTAQPHPDPRVTPLMIVVSEAFAGTADSGRARDIVNYFARSGHHVIVKNRDYSTEFYPNGESVRFRIDKSDPLLMRYDPNAKPIQLTVAGRHI